MFSDQSNFESIIRNFCSKSNFSVSRQKNFRKCSNDTGPVIATRGEVSTISVQDIQQVCIQHCGEPKTIGNTFDDCSRLIGEIRGAGCGLNIMVDVSRLAVGDGLQLGDLHAILQLHLVDRDCAVQEWDRDRTGRAASMDLVTNTELCGKLELLSLSIKQFKHVHNNIAVPKED